MAFIKKIAGLLLILVTTNLAAQDFQRKVTSSSNVRLSISNFGTFGNSFDGYRDGSGTPSCEFPAGSGIEHLFEGGIWIGGEMSGGETRVTTSALDNPIGYIAGGGGFETYSYRPLEVRSSLFDSRNFSPDAVSHEDFVALFTDTARFYPGTSIQVGGTSHERMGVEVEMKTYNWNYLFADFVVFVDLTIRNVGTNSVEDMYVGLWNNAVVRNINVTPPGSGGSQFYNKGGNGYMEEHQIAYCFDATGDLGFTESYIGQKFLGATDKEGFHHPDIDSNYNPQTGEWEEDDFEVTYNAWIFNDFSAELAAPNSEVARLDKLRQGLNESPCWSNPSDPACPGGTDLQTRLNTPGNRSDLVGAGPFASFEPGDEITVTYAYVLAKKNEDGNPNADNNLVQRRNLIDNAIFAQETYNGEDINFNGVLDEGEDLDGDNQITRFVLPTPPATPGTKVIASEGTIDIYWSANSVHSVDPISDKQDFEGFRIYLSKLGFDVRGTSDLRENLDLVAQYDSAGNGLFYDTGFDDIELDQPVSFDDGDTTEYHFKYTIDNLNNGWQYAVAVTAFDQGDEERNIQSLESSFLANDRRVFTGTTANNDMNADAPFVYPNPYYSGAAWEGRSNFQEESRRLMFANLPPRCIIRVYTVGGDFIDEIRHDQDYNGEDIRWYKTFGSEDADDNVFAGGEHAWDLLSSENQIISRGLYMFSVEDLDTGKKFTGKFVIIK